jgi:hypothetical protein
MTKFPCLIEKVDKGCDGGNRDDEIGSGLEDFGQVSGCVVPNEGFNESGIDDAPAQSPNKNAGKGSNPILEGGRIALDARHHHGGGGIVFVGGA